MDGESDLDHGYHHQNNHGYDHDLDHDLQQQQRQQRQLKRSSLPARPYPTARHKKRLTLNFPINIPTAGTTTAPASADPSNISSPGSMTPLTQTSARQSPSVGTPLPLDTQHDDGSAILTAIASQERRVLELREELQRAETELSSLKKQWVSSEKSKKRTAVNHHAEQLVSLRSPIQPPDSTSEEHNQAGSTPDSARRSKELDRRRSLRMPVSAGTSISANGRRVFQGSHARTLSLLSASTDSGFSKPAARPETELTRTPRSATLPSSIERPSNSDNHVFGPSMEPTEDMISQWRKTMPPPSREALMRTGKQMASDLREGLWTFLEDIRQATVGEEGISGTEVRGGVTPSGQRIRDSSSTSRSRDRGSEQGGMPSRSASSSSRGRGTQAGISGKDTTTTTATTKSTDIDSSFWSEFGIDTPGQKSPSARGTSSLPANVRPPHGSNHLEVNDEDNWDAWDSTPQPRKMHTPSSSRSTLESKHDQSPRSQTSSPRTSTR